MKLKYKILIFSTIILVSLVVIWNSKIYTHYRIQKLLKSNDITDIIDAYYLIGESRDTSFVCKILAFSVNDWRVSLSIRFYGRSIYQTKIQALTKISGLNPPKKLTQNPDSTIIKYYLRWGKMKGYKCVK